MSAFTLTPETAEAYLRERGVISCAGPVAVEELGWGISNVVLRVTAGGDCLVVKQSLPALRVAEEWLFDRSRILVERRCTAYLGELLPPGHVPAVRFADDDNFLFAMSCAPAGGVLWKEALWLGRIDPVAAERAGRLLAEIHSRAAEDGRGRELFADQTVLVQGRIDPYHRTAAARHPELAPLILAEVDRLLSAGRTLVLGDYSPKNTFVYPDRVLVLDFECAHWGDPAFDTAFCLNHLVLKATRFPERASSYLAAARAFWRAYAGAVSEPLLPVAEVEAATVRELGCLLLARIDGKSKVEYITDEGAKDFVRGLAREILTGSGRRLEPLLAWIGGRVEARR